MLWNCSTAMIKIITLYDKDYSIVLVNKLCACACACIMHWMLLGCIQYKHRWSIHKHCKTNMASSHRESYIISEYGETIVIERKQDPNQKCTNITFYRSANFRWDICTLGVYGFLQWANVCTSRMSNVHIILAC